MVGDSFLGEMFLHTFSVGIEVPPDGTGHEMIRGFYNTQRALAASIRGRERLHPADGGQLHGGLCATKTAGDVGELNKIAVVYELT